MSDDLPCTQYGSNRTQEIRARIKAATQGPWSVVDSETPSWIQVAQTNGEHLIVAECRFGRDIELIANAPSDLAWLLDSVEAHRRRITQLQRQIARLENGINRGLDPMMGLD